MRDMKINTDCTFSYLHIYNHCTCKSIEFENGGQRSYHIEIGLDRNTVLLPIVS